MRAMTTRRRWIGVVLLGATLTMGAAGCGSDSKDPVTTKAPGVSTPTATQAPGTTIASGNSTPTATGASGVDEFCKLVEGYVSDAKAAGNDPGKLAALQQRITEISTKLQQELTANPNQAAALQACSQKAVAAYTPG